MTSTDNPTIAFIGGGNMASSLIGGLVADGWARDRIRAADPSPDARQRLHETFRVTTTADNTEAVRHADVVVLAVKPQVIGEAAGRIAGAAADDALFISIAAGVPVAVLTGQLGDGASVVRVMPNTPALIGQGASVLYANERVSRAQRALAESLLAAAGLTLWVDDEDQMHAVTALSGSGPAYFFYLLEALTAAGTRAGLPPDLAARLALKTGQGACAMALESDVEPAELRRRVTSPGGTTERALGILDEGGCMTLFEHAVLGAAQRSRELSGD